MSTCSSKELNNKSSKMQQWHRFFYEIHLRKIKLKLESNLMYRKFVKFNSPCKADTIILSQRKEVQILSLEYVCESVRNPSYTHTHPHTIDIIFQIRAMLLLYTTKQSNRLGEKNYLCYNPYVGRTWLHRSFLLKILYKRGIWSNCIRKNIQQVAIGFRVISTMKDLL